MTTTRTTIQQTYCDACERVTYNDGACLACTSDECVERCAMCDADVTDAIYVGHAIRIIRDVYVCDSSCAMDYNDDARDAAMIDRWEQDHDR